VAEELQVPIAFIGVGEGVADLAPFKLDDFLKAFLDVVWLKNRFPLMYERWMNQFTIPKI